MIDSDPAFGQQLFDVSVRQCVAEIPADCQDDHVRREPESRERGPRRTYPTRATRHQLTLPSPSSLDATDPRDVGMTFDGWCSSVTRSCSLRSELRHATGVMHPFQ